MSDELQRLIVEIRDRGIAKRIELGLSRTEVAAAMKRSSQQIHMLETDGPRTLRLIVDWSAALGVGTEQLLFAPSRAEKLLSEAVALLDTRSGRRRTLAKEARELLGVK